MDLRPPQKEETSAEERQLKGSGIYSKPVLILSVNSIFQMILKKPNKNYLMNLRKSILNYRH